MRKIILDRADRLHRMPPEFVSLDRLAARLDKRLIQTIDLSSIDRSVNAEFVPPVPSVANLTSPPDEKTYRAFGEAVARYYEARYGADLNPEKEILPVAGTAVGLYLLAMAFVDPGEMVLVPDPGLPVYRSAVALCGGGVQTYYLYDRSNYVPDCRMISASLAGRTKLWILGYPHNPTTALSDRDLVTEVIRLARKHNILIVFDGTFSWLANNEASDTGYFANARARTVGVEIVSFDHNFGLGELNLAVLAGNKEAIAGVRFLAQSGGFLPSCGILEMGLWAMQHADLLIEKRRQRFVEARTTLIDALEKPGWGARWNGGLPFCWITLPRRFSSLGFARRLMRRAGVKITPGTVFGEQGEGYARISLLTELPKMKTAASRLVEFGSMWQKRRHRADIRGSRRT